MGNRNAKQELWYGHVRSWRDSGSSRSAYCAQHGLKLASLSYWIGRQKVQGSGLTLVPVQMASPSAGRELVLQGRSGWRLTVPASVSAQWLAELIGRLG